MSAELQIAGAIFGALNSLQEGQAAQERANYQAAVQEQQGQQARAIAQRDEEDYRRRAARLAATGRARAGASGATMEGTPSLMAEDLMREAEYNALKIRYGGDLQSARSAQQAGLYRASGEDAANRGFMRAGASLLSGAGGAWDKMHDSGKKVLPRTIEPPHDYGQAAGYSYYGE
jgi:uncharacterized protein involved in type VI secretion and phage assembly